MNRAIAVALLPFVSMTEALATDLAFERAVAAARASAVIPEGIVETASANCGTARCFASALASALPDKVRLEPVEHPDTDSIRRVSTRPSVFAQQSGGTLLLKLTHFGRKAVPELRDALAGVSRDMAVELDLGGNAGGDFERMLRIAGLLLGPLENAVEIDYGDRVERQSLKGRSVRNLRIAGVRIDRETASAALLLAELLAVHADAHIEGPPAREQPVFLKRRITIDHDWRLILPVATVRIATP